MRRVSGKPANEHRELAQQLLSRTEVIWGKALVLLFRMEPRVLFQIALLQRSRRYLKALGILDRAHASDVADSVLRSLWEYVVTGIWFAGSDVRFEMFARSHARDLRLLSETDEHVEEIVQGFRDVLSYEFGDTNEDRLPKIEQRLPPAFRKELYELYRSLSNRAHPSVIGAYLALGMDEDGDFQIVPERPEWDRASSDYVLLGCALVWQLALAVEKEINALKAPGQGPLHLFELEDIGAPIVAGIGFPIPPND